MDIDTCFAETYQDARARFLKACTNAGISVTSYSNPSTGMSGERLFTDVARMGADNASRVLIVESGTHGVEGFAGSAIQVGLLTLPEAPRPAAGTALLLVHALNPWGFSWLRRPNEDNVDLNRSFADRGVAGYPENPGYAALADAILPREWTAEALAAADAALAAYAAQHGDYALQSAFKIGQHSHPNGLFYGGRAPTWSGALVEQIVATHLEQAEAGGLIDVHTGLGPFGYGECLSVSQADTPEGQRMTAWYGAVRHTKDRSSGYSGSRSTILDGYRRAAPHLEWTSIGLEFGTVPTEEMEHLLREEGWLYAYGGADHPDAPRIRREFRDAHYPREREWADQVLRRGLEVVGLGLAGLERA